MTVRRRYGLHALLVTGAIVLVVLTDTANRSLAQDGGCPELNDDPSTACPIASGTAVESLIERPGDVDAYRVVVEDEIARVVIDLTDLPADYDFYVADGFGGLYGQSVQEGTVPEHLQVALRRGTYIVYVQADPARTVEPERPYLLRIEQSPIARPDSASSDDGRTLLSDTFDDGERGWLPIASRMPERFTVGYVNGAYRIVNTDPTGRYWGAILPGKFVDTVISLRAQLLGDTEGRAISLGCRREIPSGDPDFPHMYRLHVHPTARQFELLRWEGPTRVPLVPRQASAAIRPGNVWNHLELHCVGDAIVARANGQELASVRDSTLSSGQIVLAVAGTLPDRRRAEVDLDDLVVTLP